MTPSRTAAAETNGRSTVRRVSNAPGNANGNGKGSGNGGGKALRRKRQGSGTRPRTNGSTNGKRTSSRALGTAPVPGETPKARGERTRRRVADALISLLEEGDGSPTAKAVAERAGVSVRLVFHHFEDMESLYRMVMDVQVDRHWSAMREVPDDLPRDERIDRTVSQRAKLFDAVGPVRRAAVSLATRRADIAEAIAAGDGLLRERVLVTFSPELARAGRERRELLDALDAASSWEAWDRLRRGQSLSAPAARRAMSRTISGLLHA